jgi:hypothetical protein
MPASSETEVTEVTDHPSVSQQGEEEAGPDERQMAEESGDAKLKQSDHQAVSHQVAVPRRVDWSKVRSVANKLLRWCLFGVFFTVSPLLLKSFSSINRQQDVDWQLLLTQGDAFLISVAIAASAAGELAGQKQSKLPNIRTCLLWTSAVIIGVGTWLFADVANISNAREPFNKSWIEMWSIALFGSAVVTGACGIILSELE